MRHDAPRPTGHDGLAFPFGPGISKERVGGLFDGIVAITATLLILNVGVESQQGELSLADLAATTHQILHWAVSFVMVAVIWTEFHAVFAHSRHWDGGLMVLTFAQMGAITLVPFAADLAADRAGSLLATTVFCAVMGLNGLLVTLNVWVLRGRTHLHLDERSRDLLAQRFRAQVVVFPLTIAATMAVSWLHDPVLGVLIWALCPLGLALHLRLAGRDALAAASSDNKEIAT